MKYIHLYEGRLESLAKTQKTKELIGQTLAKYIKLFGYSADWFSTNNRVLCSIIKQKQFEGGYVEIYKKAQRYDLDWRPQGFFGDIYTLLKDYLIAQGLVYTVKIHAKQYDVKNRQEVIKGEDFQFGEYRRWKTGILIEEYRTFTIINVKPSEVDMFINAVNQFIKSDDLEAYFSAKKYNL